LTARPERLHDFQDLMRHRIMDILLVASPYDSFLLEEAGQLPERMLGEFRTLDLTYPPGLFSVATGADALRAARARRFDLVITTPHVGDLSAPRLARELRAAGIGVPVVVLAWNTRELEGLAGLPGAEELDRAFLWQGDARLFVAIVKYVEDKLNVAHDTGDLGVQVLLVVEDSVRHYSSFLPAIYTQLFQHSQRVISEGLNVGQKILRMRARPKILLCGTWEEAEAAFNAYGEEVLGVVSDVEFPRAGQPDPQAGAELARMVRARYPDVPVLLHSDAPENEALARDVGAAFLLKGSPLLLSELSRVMLDTFGFGEFVFRMPDGTEVARAADLRRLLEVLQVVPAQSLVHHAANNHFSRWLKARTEFALAHELRPRRLSDYPSPEALRADLIAAIGEYRRAQGAAVVADFDRDAFDGSGDFHRVGGGSLGGKARGLAFVRRLLDRHGLRDRFPGVRVAVPPALVVCTGVFDAFLDQRGLRDVAFGCDDPGELARRFDEVPFPVEARRDLATYLDRVRVPLAVRSSSLLEDSQHLPFTGVYATRLLPGGTGAERLDATLRAVKRVWASTYSAHAKGYIAATPYRLEEEKMAVILQEVVGAQHGARFYPHFAGVARSHNAYPTPPMRADDGMVAVALGLGRWVVEGGTCLRFCPRYPRHVPQLSSVAEALEGSPSEFFALSLEPDPGDDSDRERRFPLADAEADGTLAAVASTYSPDDDAVFDGTSRPGPRVVTFAPVLKHGLFPLAEVVRTLLEVSAEGMGSPVEMEFAVQLGAAGQPHRFGFLQLRPLALSRESEELELGAPDPRRELCRSDRVLGHGRVDGLRDLVVVDHQRFERARSLEAAAEVARLNALLVAEGRPYLLVGVGRWGSRDPWLGIPVTWDQVCGAKVIVEAGLRDMTVTPSQGSHFFQNLTSFEVGYFTVNPESGDGALDWAWLDAQPAVSAEAHVRHVRLAEPVRVLMDGRQQRGVILKPGEALPSSPVAGGS
jgi:DNA-binding NarL/FixJ family response regulator